MLRLPTGAAEESIHWAHQGLAFIALLFPAIAASLAGMEAHREHLRLEKRSRKHGAATGAIEQADGVADRSGAV
jgi:hypothetical protein